MIGLIIILSVVGVLALIATYALWGISEAFDRIAAEREEILRQQREWEKAHGSSAMRNPPPPHDVTRR